MNINHHSHVDDNDMNCAIGVEIGDSQIQCVLLREDGKVLFHRACPTLADGASTLTTVDSLIRETLAFAREHTLSVAGVGVGVPAIVEKGVVVGASEHLPELLGCDIKQRLLASFGLPVYIENDAHMMAMAENCYGNATTSNEVVFLTIGTGIGGALKLHGELYGGNRNRGGELGHMIIKFGGEQCECGTKGCLQAYASIDALIKHYAVLAAMEKNLVSVEAVVNGYLKQEDNAVSAMNWHLDHLAAGVASLINLFGPEKIIIGCQLNEIGSFYINELQQRVFAMALPAATENVTLCASYFAGKAGCIGAATMVFVH